MLEKGLPIKKQERHTPKAIGNRVKSARMLTGHSRKSFSEISDLSMATLRSWEEPSMNRSGLTEKGSERLIKALAECGIHCSNAWLFTGTGSGPKLITWNSDASNETEEKVTWGEEEAILKDIESFKANNIDPVVAILADSSMLPTYSYGDYVAGNRVYGEKIRSLIGLNCIVELEDRTVIRKISSVDHNNKYTLTVTNHDFSVSNPVISNTIIKSAAEIVWHRWRRRLTNIEV